MDSSTHPLELRSAFLTHTGIPSSMLTQAVTVHILVQSHTLACTVSWTHKEQVTTSDGTIQGCHRSTEVHTRIHTRGKLGPPLVCFVLRQGLIRYVWLAWNLQ